MNRGLDGKAAPPPGPDNPTPTFFASLVNDVNAVSHGEVPLAPTQARTTGATYRYRNEILSEPVNVIRQERLGADGSTAIGSLMEPSATNQFLNSTSPVTQNINLGTGDYTFNVRGSGSLTSANVGGTATGHGTATEGNPVTIDVTAAGTFSFTVAGSLEFAQVESGHYPSSFIISTSEPTSRAVDQLSWPTTDSESQGIINQTQGMIALIWRPNFSLANLPINQSQRILSSTTAILYFDVVGPTGAFKGRSGTSTDAVTALATALTAEKDYVIVMRYAGTSFTQGHKADGAWVWSTARTYSNIQDSGTLTLSDFSVGTIQKGCNNRNLYLWKEDKGQAWLEAFFASVAN